MARGGVSESDVCEVAYESHFAPGLLRGRVAFITGGGSGICFRIAEAFMRHGCETVIACAARRRPPAFVLI